MVGEVRAITFAPEWLTLPWLAARHILTAIALPRRKRTRARESRLA